MAERALASSIGVMPAIGRPHAKQQPGTSEISDLEELVENQLLRLFGGRWAEPRLQSCTIANAAVYVAFSKPGDVVATIAASHGGHVSHHTAGTVGLLGRTTMGLPFKSGYYHDRVASDLILAKQPRIVMVGGSVMLNPYDLENTIAACRSVGALLVYDASHVLGLIAGGCFQNPLALGVDLMTASTYKSFGGPPGGIIVGRLARHEDVIRSSVTGAWTSNFDAARLAALSVALSEATAFAVPYARSMLQNAATLREALEARRVNVTPTQTHQLMIRCQDKQEAARLTACAESAGILLGTGNVWGTPLDGGLRVGTQAVTRRGAGPDEMRLIADALCGIVSGASTADIARETHRLAERLGPVQFCYKNKADTPTTQ